MLLQRLLLHGERNRTRRRREFGYYGTIRKSSWRRGGFSSITCCKNAFPLGSYSGCGPDYLRLAHLVGVNAYRSTPDRLR